MLQKTFWVSPGGGLRLCPYPHLIYRLVFVKFGKFCEKTFGFYVYSLRQVLKMLQKTFKLSPKGGGGGCDFAPSSCIASFAPSSCKAIVKFCKLRKNTLAFSKGVGEVVPLPPVHV